MILDPGMIESHVVRHEVEHQLEAASLHPLPEPGESGVAAERRVDGVTGDREARTGNVGVGQVLIWYSDG
jgi:hypothetical protein